MNTSADASEQARSLVSGRLGLDFHGHRLHDLERAVARASRAAGASPTHYLARLAALPDESPEWRRLATQLTVGETYFFRERPCFDALELRILPAIVAERRAQQIPRLRLWSAGCSTGEEPYSLAILIDRMLPDRTSWTITILGTDVDLEALEKARRGVYREWSFRTTPRWLRHRYFRPRGDYFALDDHIREMVTFAPLNLVADTYPALMTNTTAFDVILCRNVLMYLTRGTQRATAAKLADALLPGGWLALGAAEGSAELTDSLVRVDLAGAVFGRKERRIAAPGVDQPPEPTPDVDVEPQSAEAWPVALEVPGPSPQPEPEAVESIDPTSALERARAAADRGNLEEAAELCRLALERRPLDADAYLLLGAVSQERGDLAGALAALRRALLLSPDSAAVQFLLGSLMLRKGNRARARACMATVVDLLDGVPQDEVVSGADGLTAGRLAEAASAYLESA